MGISIPEQACVDCCVKHERRTKTAFDVKIGRQTTRTRHATENLNKQFTTLVVTRAIEGGEDSMGRRYVVYGLFAVVVRGVGVCNEVFQEENSREIQIREVRFGIEE